MHIRAIAVVLGMVLLTWRLCCGEEGKAGVPGRAVSVETSYVLWVDVESATPEELKKAQAAVEGASSAESVTTAREGWKAVEEFQQVFTGAGGRVVLVVVGPAGGRGATTGPGKAGATTEPGKASETMVLVRLKPGTNWVVFVTKVRESMVRAAKALHIEPEDLARLDKASLKKLGDDWFYVTGPAEGSWASPGAAAGPAEIVGTYNDLLNANAGASVRLAVRMTETMRSYCKTAEENETNVVFYELGLMKDVVPLRTATAALWVGENPRMSVSMSFEDDAGAMKLQETMRGIMSVMNMKRADDAAKEPEAVADAETAASRALWEALLMERKGATLTTTIDTTLLRKLTELQAKRAAATQPATQAAK